MNMDNICSYFPSGISAKRTLSFQYLQFRQLSFLFIQVSTLYGRQLGDYFPNQVASTEILVAMAPKLVAAWRVNSSYFLPPLLLLIV